MFILYFFIIYIFIHIFIHYINIFMYLFFSQANSSTAQCVAGTITTTSLHPLLPGQQNTSQSSYSSDVNNKSSWSAIMSRSGDGMKNTYYKEKYIIFYIAYIIYLYIIFFFSSIILLTFLYI